MTEQTAPILERECFFIAPIGGEGTPTRNRSDMVLKYIVSKAAEELGLETVRADKIAEPGQITLQVIEHVLKAKAAVADLTDLNPNVFYELAVRHTAKLPVALIADKECNLPFDIAPMRVIKFDYRDLESADDCKRDIVAHLKQALSGGAVDSPISTTLDVFSMQSGSAVERNVADLVTSVEDLARMQRKMLQDVEARMSVVNDGRYILPLAFEDAIDRLDRLRRDVEGIRPEEFSEELIRIQDVLRFPEFQLRNSKSRRHHGSVEPEAGENEDGGEGGM